MVGGGTGTERERGGRGPLSLCSQDQHERKTASAVGFRPGAENRERERNTLAQGKGERADMEEEWINRPPNSPAIAI